MLNLFISDIRPQYDYHAGYLIKINKRSKQALIYLSTLHEFPALGSVLENDFWTSSAPPINFVHYHLFFSKIVIINTFFILELGRLRQFLGRVLRLVQARGPGPAARTGQGATAERHSQDRLEGRALRPYDHLYPCVTYQIHVQN